MITMMGPMKKGKHIGKKGVSYRCNDCTRLEISDVDKEGNPSDESLLIVQVDGEPILQTPALIEYFPNQILIRGAVVTPWDDGKSDL
mmetsp:Transcript_16708/g.20611  ORF Transcript_16708/g.20611 Transcript_16708/m.20611 type:complete len:87 (-) Transcript_16708:1400-1660(-)